MSHFPAGKCYIVLSFGGFCHIAALKYAGASGIPIVANWNDPFPGFAAPPPYGGGPNTPLPWCYRRLLARIGRAAAWHVFPCERLRGYMLRFLPEAAATRSSVIPHIASPVTGSRRRPRVFAHACRRTPALSARGRVLRGLSGISCQPELFPRPARCLHWPAPPPRPR